jgi:hypothetical protein
MPTQGFVTIEDMDHEVSTTSFWLQDVGAGNFASVTQDLDEIKDAIITVIRGVVRQTGFTKTYLESFAVVTDEEAQRENKWLVTYRDTTQFLDVANTIANTGYGKVFNIEVATAKLTGLLLDDRGVMDINDGGVGEAFKDVLQANIRSPYNHTAAGTPTIQVIEVAHVGRNN